MKHFIIGTAYKICNKDGTWFRHPISHAVWSNYTTCINLDDYNVS